MESADTNKETLSRRERERLARRQEILQAADKIFMQRGFAQATLDDIAEEADLSKGAIYWYFKSKEELYWAVIEDEIESSGRRLRQAMEQGENTAEVLRQSVLADLRHHARSQEIFPISKACPNGEKAECREPPSEGLVTRFKYLMLRNSGVMSEVMAQGAAQKIIRHDLSPGFLAVTLFSIIHGNFWAWLSMGRKPPLEELTDMICRQFLEGAATEEYRKGKHDV